MAKYLLLKHYRGAPASVNDVPMNQWTPEEISAHVPDVCGADRADQKFTFEPLTGAAGGYRVRSVPGKAYCIGVYGEHRDAGAQLIQAGCSSSLAQTFTVEQR